MTELKNPLFESYFDSIDKREAARVGTGLSLDASNPDQVADNVNVGRELGVPAQAVMGAPDMFKSQLTQKRNSTALSSAPKMRDWLGADPINGSLAKDDLDNLTWFERKWGKQPKTEFGRGLKTGVLGVGQVGVGSAAIIPQATRNRSMDNLSAFEKVTALDPNMTRYEVADVIGVDPQSTAASMAHGFLVADPDQRQRMIDGMVSRIITSGDTIGFLSEQIKGFSAQMQETQGRAPDFTGIEDVADLGDWIAFNSGQAIPFLAAIMGAGALGGAPAAGGTGYVMGVGDINSEMIEQGITDRPDVAVIGGVPYAAMEALGPAAAPFRKVGTQALTEVATGYFKRLGREVPKQAVEEFINEAGQEIIKDISVGVGGGESVELNNETLLKWFNAGMAGSVGGATMAPITARQSRLDKDMDRAEGAGMTASALDELDAMAANSKLKARSPDKFMEAMEAAGAGDAAIYVPAADLQEYFQTQGIVLDDEMLAAWGVEPSDFAEKVSSNGDLGIPASNYAARISGTDAASWFRENSTFSMGEMSLSEAAEFNSMAMDEQQAAFDEAEVQRKAAEDERDSDVKIFDSVFSRLRSAGRSPDVAKNEAEVWRSFWSSMGERYGADPLDLANSMGVDIRGPETPGPRRRRDKVDFMLNTLRSKGADALKPRGSGVLDFVKAQGGVLDHGGDVEAMDVPKGVIAETIAQYKERQGQPSLGGLGGASTGRGLDDLGRAMIEAGYFPEYMGGADIGANGQVVDEAAIALEAIGEAMAGRDRFIDGEGPDQELSDLYDQLQAQGIDLSLSNDEIAAALESPATASPSDFIGQTFNIRIGSYSGAATVSGFNGGNVVFTLADGRVSEIQLSDLNGGLVEFEGGGYPFDGLVTVSETSALPLSDVTQKLIMIAREDGNLSKASLSEVHQKELEAAGYKASEDGIYVGAADALVDEGDRRSAAGEWDESLTVYSPVSGSDVDARIKSMTVDRVVPAALQGGQEGGQTYDQSGILKTESPEFKSWFGDSKVVDADGAPLVVYHGTGTVIEEFNPELTGKGNDQIGSGFYFTTDDSEARSYQTSVTQNAGPEAKKLGGSDAPNIVNAYLSIENPLIIEGSNLNDSDVSLSEDQAFQIISRASGLLDVDDSPIGNWHDVWADGVQDWMIKDVSKQYAGSNLVSLEGDFFSNDATAFRAALRDVLGYDGVRQVFDDGKSHWVAWFPEQIKSVNNRGAFDASDPRILFQAARSGDAFNERAGAIEYAVKAPKKLWRGVVTGQQSDGSEGLGTFMLGRGLYSSPDKKFAAMYGKPQEVSIENAWPRNPLVLRGQASGPNLFQDYALKNSGFRNMREFNNAYPDPADWVRSLGFDGVIAGDEVVKYPDPRTFFQKDQALDAEAIVSSYARGEITPAQARAKLKKEGWSVGPDGFRRPNDPIELIGPDGYRFETYGQGARGSIVLPRGGLTEGQTVINLFESADLSTFLHESGHFFLEAFTALAGSPNAPAAMQDDLAVIRKFLKIEGGATPTVEQHETWARGFEAYLMEGKAPSLELSSAFSRFKSWLTRIYKTARGLNVTINNDIRAVMDRMLATDEQIAAMRDDLNLNPLFTDAGAAGMSDVDFATYQRMAQRSVEQSEARLMKTTMAKIRRETLEWYKAEKKAVTTEVTDQANRLPVYRLTELLGSNRWIGADDQEVPDMRMDRDALIEQFHSGVLEDISKVKLGGKRAIYKAKGERPEVVAEFFGFDGVDDMINALQNAGKRKDYIAAEVDRIMDERHGDPLNDGSIEEAATMAVHSEQQAATVATEVRTIAKRLGRPTGNIKAKFYRQRAKAMLGRMSVREASRSASFLQAERSAARAAERAFAKVARGAKGSHAALAEAMQAKEQQLLNSYLYKEAVEFEKTLNRGRERMRSYEKKSVREKVGGSYVDPVTGDISPGYIEQIDQLLERFDFRKRTERDVRRSESLRAYVDRMIDDGRGNELAIDDRLMNEAMSKHYTRLSVDELLGLFDTIANIDHTGRMKKTLQDRKRRRDLNEVASAVAGAVRKRFGSGKSDKQTGKGKNLLNLLWRIDTVAADIDQEEMGAFYDAIKRDLDEGAALEQKMNVASATKISELFEVYTSKEKADINTPKAVPGGNGKAWTKQQILSLAMNMGNANNIQRVLDPRVHRDVRLTQKQLDATLDTLEKRDWDFVQSVWDYIETFGDDLAAVHERRTGFKMKRVEAEGFSNKHGSYRGGYYPISYDPKKSKAAMKDEQGAFDKFLSAGRGATATVADGMTQSRQNTGGGRALNLDLSVLLKHVRDTTRVIAMSEAVDNTARVLNHAAVVSAFQDAGQTNLYQTLELFLQDVATGPVYNDDPINGVARIIKNNFTMSRLAFNFKTVALQVTGMAQSAAVVGKMNMLKGFNEYRKRPNELAAEVMAKSAFMAERQTTFQKDVYDQANDLALSSPLSKKSTKVKNAVSAWGFAPMIKVQFYAVDMPTWVAAYQSELEKNGGNEDRATHYADRMVDRSQGGGLMTDRNALERGTVGRNMRQSDFIRLWTTLGGYMVTKLNRGYLTSQSGVRNFSEADTAGGKVAAAANLATDLALLYVFEAAMMGLAYSLLSDDDDADDIKAFMVKETFGSMFGGIPFVRESVGAFNGYGAGGVLSSALETPSNIFLQAKQGENDKALRRSIADAFGLATGMPTTQAMRIIEEVVEGSDGSIAEALIGRNPLDD